MKALKIPTIENQIETLVTLQLETRSLPSLPDLEKAKFDHSLAIDQLYYSSKLEGSSLTKNMIDKAINAEKFPLA
ncbi:MAG: hypothetical protein ABSC05_38835 [Candidatus Solibacter sp.]